MNMFLGAAALTATATPVMASNPDAAIIAAAEKLHELRPVYEAAQERWNETFSEFRARRTERPEQLKWRPWDGLNVRHWGTKEGPWLDTHDLKRMRDVPQLGWKFIGADEGSISEIWNNEMARPKDEFLHLFESKPDERKQRRLNEAIEAMDADDARCSALKAEIGFADAETQMNDVYFNQVEPLQKIVVDTEAQTMAGLRAKASVLVEWFFDESDSDNNEREPTEYEKLVSDVVVGIASQDWQQGRLV